MRSTLDHRYPEVLGEFEDELGSEFEDEGEFEGEFEDEQEAEFEFETEAFREPEDEFEEEDEFREGFVNPVRRIYRDAELVAHLADRAMRVEGEAEAEAFVGAMVPLLARFVPRAAALVADQTPGLVATAARATRRLRRAPSTRVLVQAMPVLLQRTVQSLADQAQSGRPVTATTVARTLDRITGRMLDDPVARRRACRAVSVFDRRYHRRVNRGRGAR